MNFPLFVVVFVGLFTFAAVLGAAFLIPARRAKLANEAQSWPTTTATVRGSEIRAWSRYDSFPTFIFSYAVGEEYYSGCVALSTDTDRVNTLLREMDGKTFDVRYDPIQPSRFYVSDRTIEGCEVKYQGNV